MLQIIHPPPDPDHHHPDDILGCGGSEDVWYLHQYEGQDYQHIYRIIIIGIIMMIMVV